MLILDKPYVSNFLKETIKEYSLPVLKNSFGTSLLGHDCSSFVSQNKFTEEVSKYPYPQLLCPSENSLEWIYQVLPDSKVAKNALLFKDKVKFREHTQHMFPDLFYREISLEEMRTGMPELPYPCVVKPAVGFFSLSVYNLFSASDTRNMIADIERRHESIAHLYPESVLDTTRFIAEGYIKGTEYAFDAFFDAEGEPVVMGIFQHYFASDEDVSDRLYITSSAIMQENLHGFTSFLQKINENLNLRNFPLHAEVRVDSRGKIVPVEINPLRFGGWCTTADLTWHAYGFNPYLSYFNKEAPAWEKILSAHDKHIYGLVVLNNSTGTEGSQISSFNYEQLQKDYNSIIELRKTDFTKFPLFGFLFVKVKHTAIDSLEPLLKSTLKEYIRVS